MFRTQPQKPTLIRPNVNDMVYRQSTLIQFNPNNPFSKPNNFQQSFSRTPRFPIGYTTPTRPNLMRQMASYQQPPLLPLAPKPQPKPEPVDVDRSNQTKQVNYMNRPQFDIGKRPPQPLNDTNKKQRYFNIETDTNQQAEANNTETNTDMDNYEQEIAEVEVQNSYDENLVEYAEMINETDTENQYDYTYLNFLE